MVFGVLAWIAVGLIAGFIASKTIHLHGDNPNMGILLSAGGAMIGGAIYTVFSGNPVSIYNFWGFVLATIGAGVTLGVWHSMRKHSLPRP